MSGTFFVVATPIGNLQDITLRALETLRRVDVIYCEDTRRTLKLLNAFEIRKPLKSCPQFKEFRQTEFILERLRAGENVAFVTDAGSPGLCDPGSILVGAIRAQGLPIEIIGGVSSLTHFISGLGREVSSFCFHGFLPHRLKDREALFLNLRSEVPYLFFESPHRIESTLELFERIIPTRELTLAKELSKISEKFFEGTATQIRMAITSFKGEWIGCLWP